MRHLDNTRAFFLIEKSELKESDKEFLKTHIEMLDEMWNSCQAENLSLKDIIDYGKFIDDSYMKHKENLLIIVKELKSVISNLQIEKCGSALDTSFEDTDLSNCKKLTSLLNKLEHNYIEAKNVNDETPEP